MQVVVSGTVAAGAVSAFAIGAAIVAALGAAASSGGGGGGGGADPGAGNAVRSFFSPIVLLFSLFCSRQSRFQRVPVVEIKCSEIFGWLCRKNGL